MPDQLHDVFKSTRHKIWHTVIYSIKQIYGEAISESWPRKYVVLTYLLRQDSLTDNIVLSVTEIYFT